MDLHARRGTERRVADAPDGLIVPVREVVRGRVGRQPRDVKEQMTQRDGALPASTLGDVSGEGIVEPERPSLGKDHDARRRRDGLRERGQIEDRVDGHRYALGLKLPETVGAAEKHTIVAADDHDGARYLAIGDRLFDGAVDGGPEREKRLVRGCCRHSLGCGRRGGWFGRCDGNASAP